MHFVQARFPKPSGGYRDRMTHGRRDGRDHPVQFRFTERLVARQMEQMQTVVKGGRTCGGGDAVPAPDRHAKTLEPAEIRIRLLDVEWKHIGNAAVRQMRKQWTTAWNADARFCPAPVVLAPALGNCAGIGVATDQPGKV